MPEKRPSTPQEFKGWSTNATCGEFSNQTKPWYETTQNNLYTQVQELPFFAGLGPRLGVLAKEYEGERRASLFALGRKHEPIWNKKPFESFVQKLCRLNCIENDNFPNPPQGGWISLDASFKKIDDIVRTTIVVAYADGPQFLADQLAGLALEAGHVCAVKDHAKEKGYYAHHLCPQIEMPVASTLGSREFVEQRVPVEIQITTELQGALREITHKLYERERAVGGLSQNWKNDFGSGRFRAAYMAHSLRFIEAMIVDLRNTISQEEGEK